MSKLNKLFISKVFALLLIFLLSYGPYTYGNQKSTVENFEVALADYNNGLYEKAAIRLKTILQTKDTAPATFRAKVYLLLGACLEKSGKAGQAKECFTGLKKMLTEGTIDQVPSITRIDPESFAEYRAVFGDKSHFEFQKPVEVSEMLRKNVVHAPRKSIEQKQKEKKKKKFPWLIAIGAVVLVGTTAVLLLTKGKSEETGLPEIEWVKIPAGEFLMGDNFNEGDADEQPVHKVYLDEYYISKYEITIKQWSLYCQDVGIKYAYEGVAHHVKNNVSWQEAKSFCDWLSSKTDENIHLPTEAQWEKAARGTDQRRYPWGNSAPDDTKANYNTGGYVEKSPPGYYPAGVSPYGVHDMAGNLAEWCLDWYSASYYTISPEKNPTGPSSGSERVRRGGSYRTGPEGIRAASRDSFDPQKESESISFRIVKEG